MKKLLQHAAIFATLVCMVPSASRAAIVVGLVLDPFASSGSSGDFGNWQLFAVDDNAGDFGISGYNIDLVGATTIRHASPSIAIQNADGDTYQAGFSLFRS